MKPEYPGTTYGQVVWSGDDTGDDTVDVSWVWIQTGPTLYAVISGYVGPLGLPPVASGLTREQAAKLAGLLLLDPGCDLVSLQVSSAPGEWVRQ